MKLSNEYYSTKLGEYHRADAMHYAQYWYDGKFSELYKLSSSGNIDSPSSLLCEIEKCQRDLKSMFDSDTDRDESEEFDIYSQLDCLEGYALEIIKQFPEVDSE